MLKDAIEPHKVMHRRSSPGSRLWQHCSEDQIGCYNGSQNTSVEKGENER